MSSRQLAAVALLSLSVTLARSAETTPGQFDSLINNSPFGQPAPATGAQPGKEASPLEFRGVFMDKGEYFFSLHETATRSSQWVGLNEAGQPYVVESYDSAQGSIQVKYRNQSLTLTLKRAQIIVQAAPAAVQYQPGATPVVTNPTPTDEAVRMAQVAEEIRRRRALRAPPGQGPQPSAASPAPRPSATPAKP